MSPGLYVHQWNVRYVDLVDFLYKFITDCAIYGAVVGLIKTAILLDWLHMFVPLPSQNTIAWTIHVVIALNCAYYTAGTLIFIFGCTPRKRLWDKTTPGTCVDIHAVAVASGVVNMVSDFIMFAIPQMVIWRLRLTGGKKAAISSIFAIGILYVHSFGCETSNAYLTCQRMRMCGSASHLLHQTLSQPQRRHLCHVASGALDGRRNNVRIPASRYPVFATHHKGG